MLVKHQKQREDEITTGYWAEEACFVNLAGDYQYMTTGYYASQDMETTGKPIHPTCQEILDAYIVPLFLEKARLAGLRIAPYYITNDYFEPPVIVDSMNPFMSRQSVVLKAGHQERVARSLTRNFTYAICCQELPASARIGRFRAILGSSLVDRYRPLAGAIWQVFRMPLAIARVIVIPVGEVLYSGLQPLPLKTLTARELRYIQTRVTWPT
jgi:hypothetical protein